MPARWSILAVLFFARLTMAFQFQSVAALSPLLIGSGALGLDDIGLLVGLYLAPGVIVAIPGGAMAARFGDRRLVVFAMILMLAGGATALFLPGREMMVAGRLIAGAGGVVLNVLMTKMVVDWFAGREISTAMAIFLNSWPVGIALALLVLPRLALAGGLALAWWTVLSLIALGLVLFVLRYRPAPGAAGADPGIRIARLPVWPLFLAGMIWALYNAALAMVFSFGPVLLSQRGWAPADAGAVTSMFMVIFSIGLPLGGVLADRTGRRDAIILLSMSGFVVLMPLVDHVPAPAIVAIFAVTGCLFALAAGPVMTLPSAILAPESRTFGMGVFFSIYYAVMMVAPRVAGGVADRTGDAGVAIGLGALMSAACIVALWLFRRAARRPTRAE